jgi:hypothetical protein
VETERTGVHLGIEAENAGARPVTDKEGPLNLLKGAHASFGSRGIRKGSGLYCDCMFAFLSDGVLR